MAIVNETQTLDMIRSLRETPFIELDARAFSGQIRLIEREETKLRRTAATQRIPAPVNPREQRIDEYLCEIIRVARQARYHYSASAKDAAADNALLDSAEAIHNQTFAMIGIVEAE